MKPTKAKSVALSRKTHGREYNASVFAILPREGMVERLHENRHQMLPGDMAERPRPGDREIYHKPCYTGHLERGVTTGGQADGRSDQKERFSHE